MALSLVIGGSGSGTKVAVPNVVGQPQAQAEQALKDLKFKVVSAQVEAAGSEGAVFSQDPLGNTAANRGSTVRLFIIENPEVPVNIGQTLTEIKATLELVEKNADAEARKAEVLAQLALVETEVTAAERNQAVLDKLNTLETDVTAFERNQAVLDKLNTLETDAAADERNQAVQDKLDTALEKLDTLETDESAEQRKQEILDKIDEHDHEHEHKGEAAPARKSSSTRRS